MLTFSACTKGVAAMNRLASSRVPATPFADKLHRNKALEEAVWYECVSTGIQNAHQSRKISGSEGVELSKFGRKFSDLCSAFQRLDGLSNCARPDCVAEKQLFQRHDERLP